VFQPHRKDLVLEEEKAVGAAHTYEFKSHHAQHGCCLLDKVLGVMEMLYSIRKCRSWKIKISRPMLHGDNWGQETEEISPCYAGMVDTVADDLRSCCCKSILKNKVTSGKHCSLDFDCGSSILPIYKVMKSNMVKEYRKCARHVNKEKLSMRAHLDNIKQCQVAVLTAEKLLYRTIGAAAGMYFKAPKTDMNDEARKLVYLCKDLNKGDCLTAINQYMSVQMNSDGRDMEGTN
jgi:hypothetical protein